MRVQQIRAYLIILGVALKNFKLFLFLKLLFFSSTQLDFQTFIDKFQSKTALF
jgi:hypothetical protein